MDYLFSPWRFRYINGPKPLDSASAAECVLCSKLAGRDDETDLILYRGRFNAVMLNLYPYTSGHLMILPLAHVARLSDAGPGARAEMFELAARSEAVLQAEYNPDGMNLGMNLGAAAGAGIAGHIHLHLLPRWVADSNFITVVGETRVLPEEVRQTYHKLRPHFDKL